MKSQQPKAATATLSAGGSVKGPPRITEERIVLSTDHRDQSFEYWPRPSELELAHLAARLARTGAFDPKQLVKEAWDLYRESCRKIQADHREVGKMMEAVEAHNDELWIEEHGGLPQPDKFPVTFPEMDRLLLPKLRGRTGERAAVFREYVFSKMMDGAFVVRGGIRAVSYWDFRPNDLDPLREKCQKDVATKFGELRKSLYDAEAYGRFATAFLTWYRRWTDVKKSEVKSANARKGWEKRQEQKTAKMGARPKKEELMEILEGPPPKNPSPGA